MIQITWDGVTRVLEPNETIRIALGTFLTLSENGKVKLSATYKSKKYIPRRFWKDPKTPELICDSEWTQKLNLVDGIVEFDIFGDPLTLEVCE